jgi:hypothetical protein
MYKLNLILRDKKYQYTTNTALFKNSNISIYKPFYLLWYYHVAWASAVVELKTCNIITFW